MKSHLFSVRGKTIHAWTGGEGPALLLLHSGYGDAEFSWKYVWEQLAERIGRIKAESP